jgi:hypothetical protein
MQKLNGIMKYITFQPAYTEVELLVQTNRKFRNKTIYFACIH